MSWKLVRASEKSILLENGDRLHEVPWMAIASWGALLGEDDPSAVLSEITRIDAEGKEPPDWGELYDQLRQQVPAAAKAAPVAMRRAMTFGPLSPVEQALADNAGKISAARNNFVEEQTRRSF